MLTGGWKIETTFKRATPPGRFFVSGGRSARRKFRRESNHFSTEDARLSRLFTPLVDRRLSPHRPMFFGFAGICMPSQGVVNHSH
jgi:hypothetical protein